MFHGFDTPSVFRTGGDPVMGVPRMALEYRPLPGMQPPPEPLRIVIRSSPSTADFDALVLAVADLRDRVAALETPWYRRLLRRLTAWWEAHRPWR